MSFRHIEGREGLGRFVKDEDPAKAGLARLLTQFAKTWRALYGDIPLPGQTTPAKESQAPKIDLRLQTLEFLAANTFREPTPQEKEILAPRDYDIFLHTEAKTLYAVVDENRDHFWSGELDYINARPNLRDYVPPALTVALRSKELFLKNSFSESQGVQLQMHEVESQALQKQLPDVRNIMLPASTDAQLDRSFLEKTGKVLFRDRFARALDEISEVSVANVGRDDPADRLSVSGWDRDRGSDDVGVLSAVVFIQK